MLELLAIYNQEICMPKLLLVHKSKIMLYTRIIENQEKHRFPAPLKRAIFQLRFLGLGFSLMEPSIIGRYNYLTLELRNQYNQT